MSLMILTNKYFLIAISIILLLLITSFGILIFLIEYKHIRKNHNEGIHRFFMLNQIDNKMKNYTEPKRTDIENLEEFVSRFKEFSESKLKLYYDIEDIRTFVSGLLTSHTMILQGMSGTGKTSLAYAFGEFISNKSTIIPIQPMWKERTDLIGYYNEFTKRFNETELLKVMYEANYTNDIYIVVLDEVNIARIEYYFAEFLSLLELPNKESRLLDVVTDKWDDDPKKIKNGRILLKDNIWFIGTANNDDSTFAISDKVYDRAMIMNLNKKANRNEYADGNKNPISISKNRFEELASEAIATYDITDRNMRRLKALDKYMIEHFNITFGNRILKQIKQYIPIYIACGGVEIDALDDILAKKIFRKLEFLNPSYVRNEADELINFIDRTFGHDRMKECISFIRNIEKNS